MGPRRVPPGEPRSEGRHVPDIGMSINHPLRLILAASRMLEQPETLPADGKAESGMHQKAGSQSDERSGEVASEMELETSACRRISDRQRSG